MDVIRVVVFVCRSCTNTSVQGGVVQLDPLVSPGTSVEASDQKATNRPSALMVESAPTTLLPLVPVAWPPPVWTLAWSMAPVWRSFT